jgi:DNA polymerase III delta prime subunit
MSAKARHRAIIISADRAYHEAQNALLKLFEEPPPGVVLFLILQSLGGLLPTLRSRVQEISTKSEARNPKQEEHTKIKTFLKADKEGRSAIIKKLTNGKDEEKRREQREEAIALVNSIEEIAYKQWEGQTFQDGEAIRGLLSDISVLRGHLYDRSAPVKMILEHLSLVIPKELGNSSQ